MFRCDVIVPFFTESTWYAGFFFFCQNSEECTVGAHWLHFFVKGVVYRVRQSSEWCHQKKASGGQNQDLVSRRSKICQCSTSEHAA